MSIHSKDCHFRDCLQNTVNFCSELEWLIISDDLITSEERQDEDTKEVLMEGQKLKEKAL